MKLPSFREFINNECQLNEMAIKNKKEIKFKISNLEDIINLHLVKLLAYKDDYDYEKYLNDIDTWVQKIQSYDYQKTNNKLSRGEYYNILFIQPITDINNTTWVENVISRRLKEYKKLPRTTSTNHEILFYIQTIWELTSDLLSKNQLYDFKEDIFDKVINKKELNERENKREK